MLVPEILARLNQSQRARTSEQPPTCSTCLHLAFPMGSEFSIYLRIPSWDPHQRMVNDLHWKYSGREAGRMKHGNLNLQLKAGSVLTVFIHLPPLEIGFDTKYGFDTKT